MSILQEYSQILNAYPTGCSQVLKAYLVGVPISPQGLSYRDTYKCSRPILQGHPQFLVPYPVEIPISPEDLSYRVSIDPQGLSCRGIHRSSSLILQRYLQVLKPVLYRYLQVLKAYSIEVHMGPQGLWYRVYIVLKAIVQRYTQVLKPCPIWVLYKIEHKDQWYLYRMRILPIPESYTFLHCLLARNT